LPESYLGRVRGVEGVKAAVPHMWFGGVYQNDRGHLPVMTADPEAFLDVYTEYKLTPEQKQAWFRERTGAIVGKVAAQRFGWKEGDTIPMRSNIWQQSDGTNVWPLKIVAIYDATNGDNQSIYFHHKYFDESRSFGKGTIGWLGVRVENPDDSAAIARQIDSLFANSSAETKTATEKAFMQGFANQMGNIGALLTAVAAAVFFTMLLVTANTMGQSIRERLNEIGVLKTLGFSGPAVTALVFGESLLLTALGGLIGLGLASLFAEGLGATLQQFFPVIGVPASAYVIGVVLIVALGALSAALPSYQAARLRIVDALRTV